MQQFSGQNAPPDKEPAQAQRAFRPRPSVHGDTVRSRAARRADEATTHIGESSAGARLNSTMIGINVPIRIGGAFVMPGDVVLGRDGGVILIPPQLAEQVVRSSARLRDEFGHARLRAKVYTAGQIDGRWTDAIEADFTRWLRENIDTLPVARPQIEEILKRR